MRFIALGRTQWLHDSIRACVSAGHEAGLILTAPPAPEYTAGPEDFERLARELGCPCALIAGGLDETSRGLMRDARASVAISVNWPVVLSESVLGLLPRGVVNAHMGDLPRFRGNACPNWALLLGETAVVVTLHRMSTELDAGPVLLQKSCPISEDTYIGDIYRFAGDVLPRMFVDVLDGLERGDLAEQPQAADPAASLRCFPRLPRDGAIDWSRPAREIHRLVRASSRPFAGAYTYLGLERVIVWRARPEPLPGPCIGVPGQVIERRSDGKVAVLTGAGVLLLEEVQTGADPCSRPADWLTSCRMRLGLDVEQELTALRARLLQLEDPLERTQAERRPGEPRGAIGPKTNPS